VSEFLVSIKAEAFLARLSGSADRLRQAMLRVVNRLTIEVQAVVKRKLTGEVLHVRSGTLRRSVNRKVVEESGSVVGSVGTNVRYAAAHEYGFKGDVQVQGHVRKVASRSTFRNAGATVTANGISVRKGKMLSQGIAFVQPHVRSVNMPERSFLRSTLREFSDKIKRDVRAAALEALK
jgi:phage gpG-like protein